MYLSTKSLKYMQQLNVLVFHYTVSTSDKTNLVKNKNCGHLMMTVLAIPCKTAESNSLTNKKCN